MEISAEKTKVMTRNTEDLEDDTEINHQRQGTVTAFKMPGSVMTYESSIPEVLARIAQTVAALSNLKLIWKRQGHITPHQGEIFVDTCYPNILGH